jgi:hypothetical protein
MRILLIGDMSAVVIAKSLCEAKVNDVDKVRALTGVWELTGARQAGQRDTRHSPRLVNATMEGVVRVPPEFSTTWEVLPSMTEMQELVVPKSIPPTGLEHCEYYVQEKKTRGHT